MAANAVGPVAVAMVQSNYPSQYGWFQVRGLNSIALTGETIATDKAVYISGTTGYIQATDVAGDVVHGASTVATSTGIGAVGGTVQVWLNNPFVLDIAVD